MGRMTAWWKVIRGSAMRKLRAVVLEDVGLAADQAGILENGERVGEVAGFTAP